MGGENVEQRKRAKNVLPRVEHYLISAPAVVDDPGILVLSQFGHAGRSARVEQRRDPVLPDILEFQRVRGLSVRQRVEILHLSGMPRFVLRSDEGHDPRFRRSQVAIQIHF